MSRNVLIVDDSPVLRRLIRRVLMLSDFDIAECFEAGDGIEGLQVLDSQLVHVILTDINMPRMNGEQFLEELAKNTSRQPPPILVISTDQSDERMRRMSMLGASGYITKPFSPETLGVALNRLFEGVMDA